jgi:hypothetical protein
MSNYSLSECIGKVLIIAYKENTEKNENYLTEQGFDYAVVRQVHLPEYKNFSPSYLCLMNHCSAWKIAEKEPKPTLIIEADFLPVKGFGSLPIPFDCKRTNTGVVWLYTCAPQIYSVSKEGYAVGYSTSMVAYIVTPIAAEYLLEFAQKIALDPGSFQYSSWDSSLEGYLRQKQLACYVPWRNYGEHGGKPNYEHKKAGLSAVHRADVLHGQLAFNPMYIESQSHPRVVVLSSRLIARSKGISRLVLGKYLRWKVMLSSKTPLRMFKFAVGRHLTLTP